MPILIAALASLAQPASASSEPSPRWLDCSSIETPHGILIVDRIAMVFFDTDSVEITPQGAAMLDGFLTGYNAPPDCQVMIAGGADRAGSADYNLHLSRRRADAVADYLRRHGLAAPIMIEQHGETRPIVDTADGVADAQNRSVVVWVRNPPRAN